MKRLLVGGAVLALGVAGMGLSQAAPVQYKVTGGGQTLVPTDGGAGDTIAFNARSNGGDDNAADGQLQYTPHATDAAKFHGTVTCLAVNGSTATLGGIITRTSGEEGFFQLDVSDANATDPSQPEQGSDLILLTYPDGQPDCSDPADLGEDNTLDRGNVQIHKENTPKG